MTRRTVGRRPGLGVQQRLHHGMALGHPGAVVQQRGHRCSGSKSIGTMLAPSVAQPLQRGGQARS
jgi:hypothetical protein